MLKTRIIPTLLWRNYSLVKGACFDNWRQVGAVLPSIKVHNLRDVDELILIDLGASSGSEGVRYELVEEYASHCNIPLTYGGGVTSTSAIRELLLAGVDKVLINSAAYDDPYIVSKAADKFGSQCVVVGIDYKVNENGIAYCYSDLGEIKRSVNVVSRAKEVEKMGAGEILLTSIQNDGRMTGYDCSLIKKVSLNVNLPVIASGGCGNYNHMAEAVKSGASAVAAASMFLFTEQTPKGARSFMRSLGLPVRSDIDLSVCGGEVDVKID